MLRVFVAILKLKRLPILLARRAPLLLISRCRQFALPFVGRVCECFSHLGCSLDHGKVRDRIQFATTLLVRRAELHMSQIIAQVFVDVAPTVLRAAGIEHVGRLRQLI